jgi:hypothetical protein
VKSERTWGRIKVAQVVAHILSNLAVEPINQQELLDAGVVPILLKMLGKRQTRLSANYV